MGLDCRATFNNEATNYDDTLFIIPHYNEVINEMFARIDFPQESEIRVLDLGCGTGNFLQAVSQKYPNAHLYGIDFSPEMLSVARNKLGENDKIHFIEDNIFKVSVSNLPYFDLIVSSFVLHNYEENSLYNLIFEKAVGLLGVDGRLILGDLINCDSDEQKRELSIQADAMKAHGMTGKEIANWFKILENEDSPISIEQIETSLIQSGFDTVKIKKIGCTAVFSVICPLNILQLKTELLVRGIKDSAEFVEIFSEQNPNNVPKTGNSGVFLILDNKLQLLASFLHEKNTCSPYLVSKKGPNSFHLMKNGHLLNVSVSYNPYPDWYSTKIFEKDNFSSFFVLEGDKYLHIAYKSCAFSNEKRCIFCSVHRRDSLNKDYSADEICSALDIMFKKGLIPEDFHFCLGGGTYLPLSYNVDFFCKIISFIRGTGAKNPIWVEMVPPSPSDIRRMVKAGATSFGFNIEVFNEATRQQYCPGKYDEASIQQYKDAFKTVIEELGADKIGSCILAGLDDLEGLKKSVDMLVEQGVFPCVLPLKEFDGAEMKLTSETQAFLERHFMLTSQYAAEQVEKHGINVYNNEGCLHCPCCNIIHDLL
jgi:ubiquinone/menaquinone biosynthesis C-methylase UbiE